MNAAEPLPNEAGLNKEDYARLFDLKNDKELSFAETLIRSLEQVDSSFSLVQAPHPFQQYISQRQEGYAFLFACIENEEHPQWLEAADAIAHIFLHESSVLKQDLQHVKNILGTLKNPEKRGVLAKLLAIGRDMDFLSEQLNCLDDDDACLVASAAKLLGYGRFEPAAKVLIHLVTPARFYESRAVIWALGEMKSLDAVPVLQYAIKQNFRVNECLIALGKIGFMGAILDIVPIILTRQRDHLEAAYGALAFILQANLAHQEAIVLIANELLPIVQNELEECHEILSIRTKFYMLLCCARLGLKMPMQSIYQYLGIIQQTPLPSDWIHA